MHRPGHSELRGKILKARAKITTADWLMASPEKQLAEFHDLGLWTAAETREGLEAALNEIEPEHYAGVRPPQKSYEKACRGAELLAFSWDSAHFRRMMYLKLCFVKETLFVVSFHRHRLAGEEP